MLERSSKSRLIALIAGIVLAAGAADAWSQQPSPRAWETAQVEQQQPEANKQEPSANERGSKDAPLAVEIVPTKKTKAEARRHRKERKEKAAQQRALIIFNGLMVLFTLFLVASTVLLWCATRRAANATGALAEIARQQETLTRVTQRAYLSVGIGGVQAFKGKGGYVAHIAIQNAGHLPARNVSWVIAAPHFDEYRLWEPPDPVETPTGDNVVPPGTVMIQGGPGFDVTKRQLRENNFLYIWGFVTYADGVGGNQTTKFCHRYNLRLFGRGLEGTGKCVLRPKIGRYSRDYNDAT